MKTNLHILPKEPTLPAPPDSGLILEGGGMRGQYASGVMDWLLQKGLRFPYVIGVSAGISNAASYVSGQAGRNHEIFTRFAGDPRYFSWRNLWRQGNPFGMEFIYKDLPRFIPFDFEAFERSPARFRIGVTDCMTGDAVFLEKGEAPLLDALLASSSLPLIGRMARVNGRLYLDGGICAPIPFEQAWVEGVRRRVVVLTRNRGFRKKKPGRGVKALIAVKYRRFPALAAALERQWKTYNQMLEALEAEEKAERVLVIRPSQPLKVGRYSQDQGELEALYQNGKADAEACGAKLFDFLSA
ncbi:MAG: patatin family protein [Verrucomicrobiota bacterium]|jgi:predicted patatin/cPLA2 family phospholipase|nr:patatin family protein [Verrucomicrobiota bacterium]